MKKKTQSTKTETPKELKLDLGCGKHKRFGFTGVDSVKFPGVDVVADLRKTWPWEDGSVDEVHCSHFLEHLTARERVHFMNELYRVLKPVEYEGGKPVKGLATLITPYWCSGRAFGDMTHQWPPVCEFFFYYLDKDWRDVNAPHDDSRYVKGGYSCNFNVTWGYSLNPEIQTRNQEFQRNALAYYKEAASDIIATLVKK